MSSFETEAAEEAVAAEESGKTVIRPDTSEYKRAKSASGAMSQHNGDIVATRVAGFTVEQVAEVVANMIPDATVTELLAKYAHLNVGQQRMALGNRLRGAITKANKAYDVHVAGLDEGAEIHMLNGEELLNKCTQVLRDELDAAAAAAEAEAAEEAESGDEAEAA